GSAARTKCRSRPRLPHRRESRARCCRTTMAASVRRQRRTAARALSRPQSDRARQVGRSRTGGLWQRTVDRLDPTRLLTDLHPRRGASTLSPRRWISVVNGRRVGVIMLERKRRRRRSNRRGDDRVEQGLLHGAEFSFWGPSLNFLGAVWVWSESLLTDRPQTS